MHLRTMFKNLVKMNDFFHSVQLFRYEKESDYRTFTGGLISLVIIIVITIGFAQMIISTFNLTTISYTLKIEKKTNPESLNIIPGSDLDFMFGMQLNSFSGIYNLSDSTKYLDIQMTYFQLEYGKIVNYKLLDLEMCQEKHWSKISQNYEDFAKLKVSNWLCPKIGQNLTTYGKYSSDKAGGFQITDSSCRNGTDLSKTCATPEDIQNFFLSNNNRLFISLFYTNVIINADNPNYVTIYLQDTEYIAFNQKFGVQSYLSFSDYAIDSDYSIWPFQSIKKQKGFFINQKLVQHPYLIQSNFTPYFSIGFKRTVNSYSYKREVQKISSVFSFIGGLIGAVVAILFMINSFTNFSYELSLAIKVFNNRIENKLNENETDLNISPPKPNILQYIKYNLYKLAKFINKEVKWERMESISLYHAEILEQLDVKSLLKRLIFFQFCLKHIFEDYQLEELEYNLPFRPEQIKNMRRRLEDPIDSKLDIQQKSLRLQISSKIVEQKLQGKNKQEQYAGKNETIFVQQLKEKQKSQLNNCLLDYEKKQLEDGIKNFLKLHQSALKGDKISERILQTSIRNLKNKQKIVQTQSEELNKQQSIQVCLQVPVLLQKRRVSLIRT